MPKPEWKLARRNVCLPSRYIRTSDAETYRPIAEIVDEVEIIEAEAKETAKAQANAIYASEADLLNVALFGQTAAPWRDDQPDADGNIRDHAPIEQLVVLTNLESLNSGLIRQGLTAAGRLRKLTKSPPPRCAPCLLRET